MRPTARALFGVEGTPRVVVVGAGVGGIAFGVKLQRAGIDTFTIYESAPGVGGTWWHNTYPGAEVDVGSHLYCYSFKPHRWTRSHASQPELLAYLEETVDEHGLRPHIELDTTVVSAEWGDTDHRWTVTLHDGREVTCDVLVSAVGFLNVPRYPDWPGLADFSGPVFHTARWEHEHDLGGATVAVVGTGSSATQVVPAIQPLVGRLYVFQREPAWVLPKGERTFSDQELAAFQRAGRLRRERLRQRYVLEKALWAGASFRPGTKVHRAREQAARAYLQREFAERPDLREALTPRYPYFGKRPVLASTFYPALKEPNVELVPRAVTAVTRSGLVDADGVERPVDMVVLATGFQAADYLRRLRVGGRGGQSLQERWAGEPRAFLGITVSGFPNFFMLYGPGTNRGELVSMLEAQADHVVRAVKRMIRARRTAIEVRPQFEKRWDRWMHDKTEGTVWSQSANYFAAASGRIVTQWPSGNVTYRLLTVLLGRASERASLSRRRAARSAAAGA